MESCIHNPVGMVCILAWLELEYCFELDQEHAKLGLVPIVVFNLQVRRGRVVECGGSSHAGGRHISVVGDSWFWGFARRHTHSWYQSRGSQSVKYCLSRGHASGIYSGFLSIRVEHRVVCVDVRQV